jgi:hypothetical protein
MNPREYAGWLPAWFTWRDARPALEWCYLGDQGLPEPFFEDSLGRLLRHPFNRLFRRRAAFDELAWLEPVAAAHPPQGFIFHVSRCGSTLLTRQLAALPDALVLAEPGPFEALLHARHRHPGVGEGENIAWLCRLAGAFSLTQGANPGPLFIKLDAWSIEALPLLQAAFPTVPRLFLYRDPLEVLVSHARQPGRHMMPLGVEPALFGLNLEQAAGMALEEYRARVLAALFDAGLAHARSGRLQLMDYRELPEATVPWLERRAGLALDAAQRAALAQAALGDAKRAGHSFKPDGADKRAEASPVLLAWAEAWLYPRYQALAAERSRLEGRD